MRQRHRKLIGVPLIAAILVGWAAGAVAIHQAWLADASGWGQLIYFVVAGLGWFLPAALAIRWMQAPD